MSGDVPNFTFTIEGIDHLSPPYYIDAIRASTNRLRFYVDSPYFAPIARAMAPYTGLLLEADAVSYHIAQESRRVYAASCAGGHSLERSTLFGPMPDVKGTLDIPKMPPGASSWTTRSFRQNFAFVKATTALMAPRQDADVEGTALLWEAVHSQLRELLTQQRIDAGIQMISAAQAFATTKRPVMIEGFLQTREDPNTFVNFVDGTFAHVWRDAREARRFVAASQRLWQTILEHRVLPVLCPVTVMMQSRGRAVTFTPLMPLHGEPVDAELAPTDILRLLSALIGNTGGHHRFGAATAKMTDNGEAEEIADAKDQPLAAPAQHAGMYCGADGYYYITRPTAFGIILEHLRGGKTIAVPYAPLRLESYHRVFPDGVSRERGWTANDAVARIMSTAFEPVVKTLVKRARSKVTDLVQRGFIVALFRQYGLNIRFAYLVLQEALKLVPPRSPEEMAITDALEAEMLCRAMKTMYRADVAMHPPLAPPMTDNDYLEKANRLLYYINAGSRPIWEQLSTVVRGKFIGCPPDYAIPPTPKQARILTWYMTPKMGFNFDPEAGLFDKVSAALPVWYGCYAQPEAVRLLAAGKTDAVAHHLGLQWQWLEAAERPPVMQYQRAAEVGRWKKLNARLAPEDPSAQHISEDGQHLDTTVLHQQHRSQVFELLSHCVRVLSLTRLCQIDEEVVRLRLVKALDTALRYRNTNSAVFAHLCSLLIDALALEAGSAAVTHPIADIFEDTCRTVYFFGTRLVQSMCVNFAKIQGDAFEGTRAGNLFFISQALQTVGGALTRRGVTVGIGADRAAYRPYSAAVQSVTGVATDAPPLYDYPHRARETARAQLKASRGAQYVHAGMTLRLHYHSGRLAQIGNRVLSRPRIAEQSPAYIDFRVNPDLLEEALRLAGEGAGDLTLHILAVALMTHQSSMLGAHIDFKERQRAEFVKLSARYFAQTANDRRFVIDDLFVGLSMAALQYNTDKPCSLSDAEVYSDAEVVTAFTRLLAAALFAVEQPGSAVIKPIVDCHKAVNTVYPTKAHPNGLFFTKADFDLIKSSIQSPMFARNLSLAMDDVLLVRRMWVVLNTIRIVYHKGSIIYGDDEDLEEAVAVADWCNKMADVQRAYAYRRLNGRFPDGTPQREREIAQIKDRLRRDTDLYSIGIQYMETWQRHTFENRHLQSLEDAARRTMEREADEWCKAFHEEVFTYRETIGITTCQMEETLARCGIEQEECVAAEALFRGVYEAIRDRAVADRQRERDSGFSVMECDTSLEPAARAAIEAEQLSAIAKIITTTYFCYAYMPAIYKNGYMREALRSYEECIVFGSRQLILDDEAAAFEATVTAYNEGYFGDAAARLFAREADLRRRMIIHERATFNVGVFTPIETMARGAVAAAEREEWLRLIAHPQEILAAIVAPEESGRETIEEAQRGAAADILFGFSLALRHEIENGPAFNSNSNTSGEEEALGGLYGSSELSERRELLCPAHEAFARYAAVEHPYYSALLTDILEPMEAAFRAQAFGVELGVQVDEAFYRNLIDFHEHAATQRDLLFQMASHRLIDTVGAEEAASFGAICERFAVESGQFRVADYEEYEAVQRGELEARFLNECLSAIAAAKAEDYGDAMLREHTASLLEGVVEEEALRRAALEASVPAAERAVLGFTMEAFEDELAAKERWERGRLMAKHSIILEEYTARRDCATLEAQRFFGLTVAAELLASQLRGLDSLRSPIDHPALCPLVGRHWGRVVAEQRHADANAPLALPLRSIVPQFAPTYGPAEESGEGKASPPSPSSPSAPPPSDATNVNDKHGGPLLAVMAQREALRLMRQVMPEPEHAELRLVMEEAVRRTELVEWYGHFAATARAEWENIMIVITERPFPEAAGLLACVPTAASINVAPLLLQPAHVVSRVTAHARRLVLSAGHEAQRCYDSEAPLRAAMAKRHRELVVELRKPAHRRLKRVLKEGGGGGSGGVWAGPDLTPTLAADLLPIHPAEVPEMLAALSLQQRRLLKLLLYEDTAPVEATLRRRLHVAEHRAAMGLFKVMKEEEAEALAATAARNNSNSTNTMATSAVVDSNAASKGRARLISRHRNGTYGASSSSANPFAALNATLATLSARSSAADLSLIPPQMIALAKAIAEGRYYNTISSTDEAIASGAFIKPSLNAKGGGPARGGGFSGRSGAFDDGDGRRTRLFGAGGADADGPFDPTTLPPFRVYADCAEALREALPSMAHCSPSSPYGLAATRALGLWGGLGASGASSRPGSGLAAARRSRPNSAAAVGVGGGSQHHIVHPMGASTSGSLHQRPPSPHRLQQQQHSHAPTSQGQGGLSSPRPASGALGGRPPSGSSQRHGQRLAPLSQSTSYYGRPPTTNGGGVGGGGTHADASPLSPGSEAALSLQSGGGVSQSLSPSTSSPPRRYMYGGGDGTEETYEERLRGSAVGVGMGMAMATPLAMGMGVSSPQSAALSRRAVVERLNQSAPAKALGVLSPLRGGRGRSPAAATAVGGTASSPSSAAPQNGGSAAVLNQTMPVRMDAVFSPTRRAGGGGGGGQQSPARSTHEGATLVFHKRTAKPNRLPTLW